MNRLLPAYRALWDRHRAVVYVTLLVLAFGSAGSAVLTAWRSPNWAAFPAAFTVAVMLLLWFEPGGES